MTAPVRILVVDDDDAFRRSLARTLANHGYSCLEAAGCAPAMAAADTEPDIQAILCDISMPGESGIDLLRHVVDDHPGIAVVMMTGIDDPRVAELSFEIGAFGYVVKPFDTNQLLISLAGALRRRDLEIATRAHVRDLESSIARTRALRGVLDGIADDRSAPPADDDTIERLSRAVSLREEETSGHIERMSRYAAVLAEASGFAGMTPDDLRMAAALHDVGKIGVPDSVLLKPGRLSGDEHASMQRHAQLGYQLLAGSASGLLQVAAGIALSHHEWWDGRGYPRGLQGDEIPLEARIAAVCDVFDSMTSDRVYRSALALDEAAAVLTDLRGRQFEPRLVDAFLGAMDAVASIREAHPDTEPDQSVIRVLLVDDQELFTQSLIRLLQTRPTVKVVATAATVAEASAAALAHVPHVVLMDFELPDGDGATATEQIKARLPSVKVVMLTARTDDQAMVRAIQAGCSGFITKHEPVDALVAAIHAAHDGEVVAPVRDLAPLLRRLRPSQRGLGRSLRPREIEVLALVAAGLPNKQIAERLTLSVNTVRNHVQSILYKLQAHSKLEAVATGVREGVIQYPRETLRG